MNALKKTISQPEPVFTRYLYEKFHVKYSLLNAITSGEREESLFWAYELYHSGFQEYVWDFVVDIYKKYYEVSNPRFARWLEEIHTEWMHSKSSGSPKDCLLGSIVGTLAKRVLSANDEKRAREKFLILYREDRHKTMDPIQRSYRYLEKVSKYPIRSQSQREVETECGLYVEYIREAYLGPDWLFYCRKTPIWLSRILEFRGIVDEEKKTVAFESDDDLEEFYKIWGFEPDEQIKEMHICHGVYRITMQSSSPSRKIVI